MKKKATKQGQTWVAENTNPNRRAPYTIIMEENFHDLYEEKEPAAKKRAASARKARSATALAPHKRSTPVKAKAAAPAKKKGSSVPKGGLFSGATEISMTKNKISVTKKVSENRNGSFEQHEVRVYHDKTPATMRALQEAIRSGNAKKVTVKFK